MNLVLAFMCGIIITVMNVFNGELSNNYGTYIAVCIIHLVGLITFIVIMFIKKQRLTFKNGLQLWLYSGGVVGVLTVIFNVVSINDVGAALLTALGLLGQMITSILLEYKGWFGSIQKKLTPIKCLSLIIVMIGIGVMML